MRRTHRRTTHKTISRVALSNSPYPVTPNLAFRIFVDMRQHLRIILTAEPWHLFGRMRCDACDLTALRLMCCNADCSIGCRYYTWAAGLSTDWPSRAAATAVLVAVLAAPVTMVLAAELAAVLAASCSVGPQFGQLAGLAAVSD